MYCPIGLPGGNVALKVWQDRPAPLAAWVATLMALPGFAQVTLSPLAPAGSVSADIFPSLSLTFSVKAD